MARHQEARPVSEEEFAEMPARIERHFDRVRELLDEARAADGADDADG